MKHILKHTFRIWWSVLLAAVFLCGCASTEQVLPKPSEEKPTANKALIIVEPLSQSALGMARSNIYDNDRLVGKLGSGGKLVYLRDPGPMKIGVADSGWYMAGQYTGRSLAVVAGEQYRYEFGYQSTGLVFDGPGVPINNATKRQSPEDSLVLFRIFQKDPKGFVIADGYTTKEAVRIMNIKTGKLILLNVNPLGKETPWLALYLSPGEYYVSTYEIVRPGGVTYGSTLTTTYKINAEFAITKPNVSVYVGDITFSGDKKLVSKDSDAAREFLKQNSMRLPYTEAIMELN